MEKQSRIIGEGFKALDSAKKLIGYVEDGTTKDALELLSVASENILSSILLTEPEEFLLLAGVNDNILRAISLIIGDYDFRKEKE